MSKMLKEKTKQNSNRWNL